MVWEKKPFWVAFRVLLDQEKRRKGSLVEKFKKSRYETCIFVNMEFSHLVVRKHS